MGFDYAQNLIRRSRLIMPANEKKYVEKAHMRNADAVVLDLEDSVPVSEKVATRAVLKESIPVVGRGGSDVLVRVNHTDELLKGDVEASVWPGLDGIFFPKVETGDQVRDLDRLLADLERKRGIPPGHVKISVIAETLKGYLNVQEITGASDRIDSLSLGTEDFATNTGMELSEDTYQRLADPKNADRVCRPGVWQTAVEPGGQYGRFHRQRRLRENGRPFLQTRVPWIQLHSSGECGDFESVFFSHRRGDRLFPETHRCIRAKPGGR